MSQNVVSRGGELPVCFVIRNYPIGRLVGAWTSDWVPVTFSIQIDRLFRLQIQFDCLDYNIFIHPQLITAAESKILRSVKRYEYKKPCILHRRMLSLDGNDISWNRFGL
jgi:hypothetical protein